MQVAVIVNPRAGKGSVINKIKTLRKTFGNDLMQLITADSSEQATSLAKSAAAQGADAVVAAGGDGTVNAVANGLIGSNCPLGIVPVGSANDLADNCGIPLKIEAAAKIIMSASAKNIDAIRVNGWHYLTCGGVGFPCDVIKIVEQLRRGNRLKKAICQIGNGGIYAAATFLHLLKGVPPALQVHIETENLTADIKSQFVVISNQSKLGRRFVVAPSADNSDGMLDVCTLTNTGSLPDLARILLKISKGTHEHEPGVEVFRARSINIRTASDTTFFGDGELKLCARTFNIKVIPSAIRIICPD